MSKRIQTPSLPEGFFQRQFPAWSNDQMNNVLEKCDQARETARAYTHQSSTVNSADMLVKCR